MNSGNMFLAIGAMIILSTIIFNINRSALHTATISQNSEGVLAANGIAQGLLEEIRSESYDEKLIGVNKGNYSHFTPTGQLGPDAGESISTYDDIDDYNGAVITNATPRMGTYSATVTVGYVSPSNPDQASGSPTRTKKITVVVTNPFMSDTLRASHIASY